VASLAALVLFANISSGVAASASQKAFVSYATNSSNVSRAAAEQPVPPNCIRQECGKLWCWQMGGGKSKSH
jgi:hypothetical protein